MSKKKSSYVTKQQYRVQSKEEERLSLAIQSHEVDSLTLPVGMKVRMLLPFVDLKLATPRISQSRKYRVMKVVTVKKNYPHHITFTDGVLDWDMTKADILIQRNKKVLDYGTDIEVKEDKED